MGFLDNSGDIILDAVLTDTGRYRLAQGNGSFKITKFALGDDEINYGSYNKNHPSGSAYYDLEILQTPVLEAFTNNTSTMKSKLISITRTNLLYLPVLRLNTIDTNNKQSTSDLGAANAGTFIVAVNTETIGTSGGAEAGIFFPAGSGTSEIDPTGAIKGIGNQTAQDNNFIKIDQGLDTNEVEKTSGLDADLVETQYIIEMDNRLGQLRSAVGTGQVANESFIDDDNIASYYVSRNDIDYVGSYSSDGAGSILKGPAGTFLQFSIQNSRELQTSSYLFETLGSTGTANKAGGGTMNIHFIDTTIKVTGATTGVSIDIPVRYVRKRP
jgi:hypothetical protein